MFYRYKIESKLTQEEVISRIQSITGDVPTFWKSVEQWSRPPERPFAGKVKDYSFTIIRQIRYKNPVLPQIRGLVKPTPSGSKVSLTMMPHPPGVIVLAIIGVVGVLIERSSSLQPSKVMASFIAGGGIWILLVVVLCGFFFCEAIKARRLLETELSSIPSSFSG